MTLENQNDVLLHILLLDFVLQPTIPRVCLARNVRIFAAFGHICWFGDAAQGWNGSRRSDRDGSNALRGRARIY